ncbi:ammonium transporter [Corynebacterium mendelii]|nr:ammonium transporter [Corynebacterium mendelii]
MLFSAAAVLMMTPALAFFYGGMSRQKSVLNMMMMSFGSLMVVIMIYVGWGWSMSYGDQSIAGIVANPFQYFGLKDTIFAADGSIAIGPNGYATILDVGFQMTFAVIAVALISGALAERVKWASWLVFAGLWATFAYFPLAHMVWGGGLLSHAEGSVPAMMFGTDTVHGEVSAAVHPIDFAGGVVVHISAGTAALVLAYIVGHRNGFLRSPHRPHNIPLTMLGASLLWFGWAGFNGGSAFGATGLAALAWVNTAVAAAAATAGWLIVERVRDGHATSLGAASGVVAGLVTITPAAGDLTPVTSIAAGVIGGAVAALGVGIKYRFKFDDSLDVVGVHLMAGLWGTVAIGLFATDRGLFTGGGMYGLKLTVVQIVIAVVAMVFTAIVTAIIAYAIKAGLGWRIDREHEFNGIDFAQHGETAYDHAGADVR